MFVTNNILRKSIFACTSHLMSVSNNAIICTIQNSWVVRETVWKSWADKLYHLNHLNVLTGAKNFTSNSTRIWNTISTKIDVNVTFVQFKANLKLYLFK